MRQLISYSAKCCPDIVSVPQSFFCFLPQLQREFCKLKKRHEFVVTKNPRILRLAQPRNPIKKFYQPCKCDNGALSKVDIICEEPPRTRTEQLAYPLVHKLLELKKQDAFKVFDSAHKDSVNRTLRKSILSVYTRLSHAKVPERKVKQPPMTEEEKKRHLRYLRKLAKPNRPVKNKSAEASKPKKVKKMTYGRMKGGDGPDPQRMKILSIPRIYQDNTARPWQFDESWRNYKPTKRLLKLAAHKVKGSSVSVAEDRVSHKVLSGKGYERLRELAIPTKLYQKTDTDVNPNAFNISRNALKAIATKRIIQLAEPKQYLDSHTRNHPYQVSPRALRAVLTPRLKELATPKNRV